MQLHACMLSARLQPRVHARLQTCPSSPSCCSPAVSRAGELFGIPGAASLSITATATGKQYTWTAKQYSSNPNSVFLHSLTGAQGQGGWVWGFYGRGWENGGAGSCSFAAVVCMGHSILGLHAYCPSFMGMEACFTPIRLLKKQDKLRRGPLTWHPRQRCAPHTKYQPLSLPAVAQTT